MRRKGCRFILLWSWLCVASAPAGASVLIHLDLEEMTTLSSAILLGRCVEIKGGWNEEGYIVTNNVFEVREYYKGNLGSRVIISELGGQAGDRMAEYPGVPRFRVGEEAVLFVWTDRYGRHQVIGLTQGKFQVRHDSKTGEVVLCQAASTEPMIEPRRHSHTAPVEPLRFSLAAFRSRVNLMLRGAAAQGRSGGSER